MAKYLLESVDGVQWFGIAALLLFFTMFVLAFFKAALSKKNYNDKMARMPLDD